MSELEKIKVEAGQNEGAEPMTDEQAKKPKLKTSLKIDRLPGSGRIRFNRLVSLHVRIY